jgi:peroxin-7
LTPDSTYDICFNEANASQILSAGGDGSIKLWDTQKPGQQPILVAKGHQGEVFGCEWNHINKRTVLTASFDKTIGLWDATQLQAGPKQRFQHDFTVYEAKWHPTHESIFGSCSGD